MLAINDEYPVDIQKPPATRERYVWPRLFDWIAALVCPLMAIGGYVALQTVYWGRGVYWTDWTFLVFATVLPTLCIALMAIKPFDIMARRVYVPMLAIAGFVAEFWVCHPAIRFVHEWKELRLVGTDVMQFPADLGEGRNHDSDGENRWGRYHLRFQDVTLLRGDDYRRFGIVVYEQVKGKPPDKDDLLKWMTENLDRRGENVTRKLDTKIEAFPAQYVFTEWNFAHTQMLYVAQGTRGYVLTVTSIQPMEKSVESKKFFDSLRVADN